MKFSCASFRFNTCILYFRSKYINPFCIFTSVSILFIPAPNFPLRIRFIYSFCLLCLFPGLFPFLYFFFCFLSCFPFSVCICFFYFCFHWLSFQYFIAESFATSWKPSCKVYIRLWAAAVSSNLLHISGNKNDLNKRH